MEKERALIVGIHTNEMTDYEFELSMTELEDLCEACDMEAVASIRQHLDMPNKALYIGSGKLEEVKEIYVDEKCDVLIFDNTLSPMQIRNIQNFVQCPVMDRTGLILEIFERRARSMEARLQVEVAKLQYMLPRLVGLHEALSRQGGTSGSRSSRGAGEKKLELDRRKLSARLTRLKAQLREVKKEHLTQRKKRAEAQDIRVAFVGYTNAGKSTLMNAMIDLYYAGGIATEKTVFEKDMLFATLDTTTRQIKPKNHRKMLLSDTVGFISHLPHDLIEAFRSTLDEALEADVLVHVIDASDENHDAQIKVTEDTLYSLGASDIPTIRVYNKADLIAETEKLPRITGSHIYLSAKQKIGMDELLSMIEDSLAAASVEVNLLLPYNESRIASYICDSYAAAAIEYTEEGIHVHAWISKQDYQRYQAYVQ